MVALLHDLGHYPLSHLYEQAISRFTGLNKDAIFHHEKAGALLVSSKMAPILDSSLLNEEFKEELSNQNLEPVELSKFVSDVIGHASSGALRFGIYGVLDKLLSGAVDCDRLDYLLRTSAVSGLPYGVVDLDYLVCNVKLQSPALNVIFSKKAQNAASHVLEARVYDYLSTSYHKTVKAFEHELIEAISVEMESSSLPAHEENLRERADSEDWLQFDDSCLRSTLQASLLVEVRKISNRVFHRIPRKTLFSTTLELSKRRWESLGGYKTFKKALQRQLLDEKNRPPVPGDWFLESVEALDASDVSTFVEMESEGFRRWQSACDQDDSKNLRVTSQFAKLRDRVTFVLHFYLSSEEVPLSPYKGAHELELEGILFECLDLAAKDVEKLAG